MIELLSRWDPILQEHVQDVMEYQEKGERLQAHYQSPESQNKCYSLVKHFILQEGGISKYFSVCVDATPDSSHVEQATFRLWY